MQNMEGLQYIRAFSFKELKEITNEFSEERVIGSGGSGVVYMGVLDNAEVIAVKKLRNHCDSSGKQLANGHAQFQNEVMTLCGVQHPNIIRLVGYCYEAHSVVVEFNGKPVLALEEERVLCLEYMPCGSLNRHLSDESCGLEWHTRFNIIKGVCEGLKYLHTGSENPIYHLDLKPENIWLDGNMIPKIGDFGISRLPVGSMQTYTTTSVSGTFGYMAPEYIDQKKISQKCDIYSLGFIMIRIIAGETGPQNYDRDRPSEEFIESVREKWGKRLRATMSSHSLLQVKSCTEIALRCVEYDREKRPTITGIVDELNKIDGAESSCVGGKRMKEEEHTSFKNQHDIQEPKENNMEHLEQQTKGQVSGRTGKILPSPVTMDLHKAAGDNSAILSSCSRWNGLKEQDLLHIQSCLQRLRETLPVMYKLIDVAEWKRHENFVAMLFSELKDAVYDADDLLDEFRWHQMKVKLEENATKSPYIDFIDTVIQGNFNKVNDVQGRLDHLSSKLEKMGLCVATQRFDKTVRPETSSLPNEAKIFGREKELKNVMKFLSVPTDSKRKRATRPVNASTSGSVNNQVSNESGITHVPVLPIVGIGGAGKTTLAQHICSHKQVKSHFELVIWICVSDDFDVKRLTREAIESCPGNMTRTDNLDSLQRALSNHVNNKRLLLVLDDMWDDALKENGQCWKRFCAPFFNAKEGSMMLVTTRSRTVAKGVGTMEPVTLEGLKDDVFWNFFKLCAFGSESSDNDPELEIIGRKILPKLKGSPLAAKTLGRMLRMDLQASRWNDILESELWKLPQEVTEILPALRLSYMYLPFYLKQCFSFCAVYPKDYKFKKEDLAEIWVAEGFVEPQGDHPIKDIACQYFEDLVARSFFQKVNGGYVIHDLLHDMAQKVSEHDCFILRNKDDFDKVPPNVRHIYVHPSSDFDSSNLSSLCRFTKLRTLICKKQSGSKKSTVMEQWFTKLLRIRVMSCASTNEIPDSIGNLKHLRYLKISIGRLLSIPPSFCLLYNLQILDIKTCKIESLPNDFRNLSNLQRFESQGFLYYPGCRMDLDVADKAAQGIRLIKHLNQFRGHLKICNVGMLSKDHAAEIEMKNKKDLYGLSLDWYPDLLPAPQDLQQDAIEVLQLLQPPVSLKSLFLRKYPGVSLPRWFGDLSFLEELYIDGCPNICSQSLVSTSLTQLNLGDCGSLLENIDCCSLTNFTIHSESVTSIHAEGWSLPSLQKLKVSRCKCLTSIEVSTTLPFCVDNGSIRAFSKLHSLRIEHCDKLSNVDGLLTQEYLPVIEKIHVTFCSELVSLLGEKFGGLSSLKHLEIYQCPRLNWQSGLVLPSSLQTLELYYCGDYSAYVPGCLETLRSLESLTIVGCEGLTSIPGTIWHNNLGSLKELEIWYCPKLVSIGGAEAVANIKKVEISHCPNFQWRNT